MNRRLLLPVLGLCAVIATAVGAAPHHPASAQGIPDDPVQGRITLTPSSDWAGATGSWSINVAGEGWRPNRTVTLRFEGQIEADQIVIGSDGTFSHVITPARRAAGAYQVDAESLYCNGSCSWRRAQAEFTSVPPEVTLTPSCSSPGTSQTLAVSGRGWTYNPQLEQSVQIYYDYPVNTKPPVHTDPDAQGDWSVALAVTPPNREVPIRVDHPSQDISLQVIWEPCPPTGPGSTTVPATTSTTRAVTTTTTALPGGAVPPPSTAPLTPVTLEVEPRLGPGGIVAAARGTGWPEGTVQLRWSPGIGAFTATVGVDGTFSVPVLVFHRDVLGPRTLSATDGRVSATTPFLVVPSSVQPSGQDVAQISRARRFLQR